MAKNNKNNNYYKISDNDAGFEISRTHYGGTTFKTNATISEIYEIAND